MSAQGEDDTPDDAPSALGSVPTPVRVACAILAAEALALFGITVFVLISTVTGHPGSVGGALVGAALVLVAALALLAGARGLLLLRSSARTPVVVLQLLAIPVSYTLAFQADRVEYGGPILIAALAVLYLLFTPPARQALDRELN